jgi:uncharacterized protein (TIGR03437 family)
MINQGAGSCSFSFNPGTIGAGRVVQYERTNVTGNIDGNTVIANGGTLMATGSARILEASYTATGTASETMMTLSGSGPVRATQPIEGGQTAQLDCTFTSTARFSRAGPQPLPSIRATQPVLQAFQGGEKLSRGTWVEIYGENFTNRARDWTGLIQGNQAPTSIDNVRVLMDNRPAYLYYLSPTQINAQVPDGVGTGRVAVEVVTGGGRASTTAEIATVSPALLTTPAFRVGERQYVAALFATDLNAGRQVFAGPENMVRGAVSRPAKPGDVLTIFAVGCGPTDPASGAGTVVQGTRPLANPLQVLFGQSPATASGYLAPGVIGLCQINATVPNVAGPATGDLPISISIGGIRNAQNLYINVQP